MANKVSLRKEMTSPLETDKKVQAYLDRLSFLRKEGSTKIAALKEELYSIKHAKIIDEVTRNRIILSNKALLKKAEEDKKEKKGEIQEVAKEAIGYILEISLPYEKEMAHKGKKLLALDKPTHRAKVKEIKERYRKDESECKAKNEERLLAFKEEKERNLANFSSIEKAQYKKELGNLKSECKDDLNSIRVAFLSSLRDEKNRHLSVISKKKDMAFNAYLSRYNKISNVRDGKVSPSESIEKRFKNYLYSFSLKETLINNALYIAVAFFFIACFIASPLLGSGNILTWENISGYLESASSRIFFTLGVAGLIVLGGTDLSVGRLLGLGSVCVGFLLHDGTLPSTLFGHFINLDGIPVELRVVLALLIAILATTLFSSIAGFFTAKFKIHAFITTLSTMMIVYGLGYVATSGTPTGPPDVKGIDDVILGRIGGSDGFPKYIIYAIIAIAIVWFIWNKTRFGKNMFAVGGNKEAATVSGISCFKVTFLVFVMAGILYGFGSFFFALTSNPASNAGYGYELDAIAACVVGGVSFLGGIGKVKGAVIGCCIFTGLSYVLSLMGASSYYQFIIKGTILLAAVSLDSLRFAKKK